MESRHKNRFPIKGKPRSIFDPKNQEHRRQYAIYLAERTWSKCPIQFVIDDDSFNLPHCIERKLLGYYTRNEFKLRKKQ